MNLKNILAVAALSVAGLSTAYAAGLQIGTPQTVTMTQPVNAPSILTVSYVPTTVLNSNVSVAPDTVLGKLYLDSTNSGKIASIHVEQSPGGGAYTMTNPTPSSVALPIKVGDVATITPVLTGATLADSTGVLITASDIVELSVYSANAASVVLSAGAYSTMLTVTAFEA